LYENALWITHAPRRVSVRLIVQNGVECPMALR
jgi:hypothetical protein